MMSMLGNIIGVKTNNKEMFNMDIIVLNNNIADFYLTKDQKYFELLLVDIDNIIKSAAYINKDKFEDKILYQEEDIAQEIRIKLWLFLTDNKIEFKSEQDLKDFILSLIEEVLNEVRS